MRRHTTDYDVLIVGAGTSGAALLYTLSKYTDIKRVALYEKYGKPGQVNSKASNNSQTLHTGDIETNYSIEKSIHVQSAAMMIVRYADQLPEKDQLIQKMQKMVLGVGTEEVNLLTKRYQSIKHAFPKLQQLSSEQIRTVEPAVMYGRGKSESVTALYSEEGYAVNFEELAKSFIKEALRYNPDIKISFGSPVTKIAKTGEQYTLVLKDGTSVTAQVVIVDADSYSLLFAKQLGYGKQYSLIPIAGTFYFSEKILRGKVYSVQEERLPFAAIHGDPDLEEYTHTRWGPTARFFPALESRNLKTVRDYFRCAGLFRFQTWVSFVKILLDPVRFLYLFKNLLYELPCIGKRMFTKNVRKIIPSIKAKDLQKAYGYGGMRLQRVDTTSHELQLGEGKIVGDNIIFNMTPSPGASVCLYNALRDSEHIVRFLKTATFQKKKMEEDLVESKNISSSESTSIEKVYVS